MPCKLFLSHLQASLASAMLLLLCGCTEPGPDAPYEIYLDSLGRTLDVRPGTRLPRPYPRPPRTDKLQLHLSSDDLHAIDFAGLRGCAVQATMGKFRSSLGRMARPSQRLLLTLEYLRLAPDCIDSLRLARKVALANSLRTAWVTGHEQLPALIYNATLGGEEFRTFWTSAPGIAEYPQVDPATTAAALLTLNDLTRKWLQGDYNADNRAFEILLSEVAGGGAGRLLKTASRQAEWLEVADLVIEQKIATGPLCPDESQLAAAAVLPKVVQRYFIQPIMAQAAAIHRRSQQAFPPVASLEAQLANTLPDTHNLWAQTRDERIKWATPATGRHLDYLQALQKPCKQQ